ncbi:MAG: metallophosphoesterase N-terminal domain-containing protein, partial [bacterium]
MKRMAFLLMCFFLIAVVSSVGGWAQRATSATGVVFEDSNENNSLDPGELGIPNVLVSNQLDVVKTDAAGRYTLPLHDEETIIFVIKPPDYSLPLNEDNLPQFYYIHQPVGSPDLKYPGVEPTGDLPDSVDFPLCRSERTDDFKVVVFADPQPCSDEEISYVRDDVVAEVVGTDAAFGITLGDIAYGDLSLFEHYNNVVAQIGIPFYNVPGNHDMNSDVRDDQYSLETYKKYFGPPYYAFEHGMVSFILLDSMEGRGSSYIGKLGAKQLDWIENYLAFVPSDRLIVFAMHIPLYSSRGTGSIHSVTDRASLFDLLKDRSHLLALTGHAHIIENVNLANEIGGEIDFSFPHVICSAVSGAWWSGPRDERGIPATVQTDGSPNGYHICYFSGNQYTQKFK